ncbi:MAG: DMT family transporter, partial [Solirubrobacterales bacterium]|nr:DMT family transporter [Solirubrobacterales bacterium]
MSDRRSALAALVTAGLLWGLTVPLSKLALEWLDPAGLTVVRFSFAALPLALLTRRGLRRAFSLPVVAWGAGGYGLVIIVQNLGIGQTSVSHAALIVGAAPVLVALLNAALGRGTSGLVAWTGFGLALAGVALVAGGGGDDATLEGDLFVLLSVAGSAAFIVAQPRLLAGRDPASVTAVQLGAGAVIALPIALAFEGLPSSLPGTTPLAAAFALAFAGTLLPFVLFALGQARVTPELAGAFVNLEPLVGGAVGALAFHDAFGGLQLLGATAILAGIALSAAPRRTRPGTTVGGRDGGRGRTRPPRTARHV